MTTLVLIAKQPLPGQAKTRLSPPLTPEQAARIAAACIDDTVAALASAPVSRRVVFFQGSRVPDSAAGYDVIAQPTGSLDERLAYLFDVLDEPTVLIGMDTPQVVALDLAPALEDFSSSTGAGHDAWLGLATDGGFWALGMRRPSGDVIRGVPMSRADTGAVQLERVRSAGLSVGLLRELTDIDTITEARSVARTAPDSGFAALLSSFEPSAPVHS